MAWCQRCAVETSNPIAAVGKDEDGEPACHAHAVKPPAMVVPQGETASQPETREPVRTEPLDAEQIKSALPLHRAGKSVREIASALRIPVWRFHQSPAWRVARDGTPVDAKPERKSREKKHRKANGHANGAGLVNLGALKQRLQRGIEAIELLESLMLTDLGQIENATAAVH